MSEKKYQINKFSRENTQTTENRKEEIFSQEKRQCKDNIGNCSLHQAATIATFGEKISANESSSSAFFLIMLCNYSSHFLTQEQK